MNLIEYNDVLPDIQHRWFKEVVTNPSFHWGFIQDSAYSGVASEQFLSLDDKQKNPSFSMSILESDYNHQDRYWFEKFELIFLTLLETAKLDKNLLQRARLGLYLPMKTGKEHNNIHTDRDYPHTVLLYYVNDNDGDTYWFDENDNIIHKFTPKANTAVVFDGMIRHASSNPSTGFKISLNLNVDARPVPQDGYRHA